QVQVVDKVAAERGLQRLEYILQLDAEDLHLVAVDIEIDRRIGRRERREHSAQLRVLVGRYDHPAQNLGKLLRIAAPKVLKDIGEASTRAETDNRRRCQ